MREGVRIIVTHGAARGELEAHLRRIVGDAHDASSPLALEAKLFNDDSRLEELRCAFSKLGFSHTTLKSGASERVFTERAFVTFDDQDLRQAELFELLPLEYRYPMSGPARSAGRNKAGLPEVVVDELPPDADFLLDVDVRAMVPSRVASVLADFQFKGLAFRETVPVVVREGVLVEIPWREANTEPWQELESDIDTPLPSPSLVFTTKSGKQVSREHPEARFITEQNGKPLHQRVFMRSEIEAMGEFDIACARGFWGRRNSWTLIVSRHFYEVCIEQNLKAEWIPVRLESE